MFLKGIGRALVWGLIFGGLMALGLDVLEQPSKKPLLSNNQQGIKSVQSLQVPNITWDRVKSENFREKTTIQQKESTLNTESEESYQHNTVSGEVLSRPPETQQIALMPPKQLPNPHLNKSTDNLNVLFVGVAGQELKMVTVYSIDINGSFKSGAVFFPVNTYLKGSTLEKHFQYNGVSYVQKLLEDELEIDISYYVKMDKKILSEVKTFIDPIIVDNKVIDIENLFNMKVTPQDEEILGKLMEQLTKPEVYFLQLPKLVFVFRKYMETDFRPNLENLKQHFKIARNIDTSGIIKVIAGGRKESVGDTTVWIVPETILKNIVYQVTK